MEEWIEQAKCTGHDPEMWFPFTSLQQEAIEAKRICGTCEVTAECYSYAIRHRISHGIWGGIKIDRSHQPVVLDDDVRDAVESAVSSGWDVERTARHLRIHPRRVRRLVEEMNQRKIQQAEDQDQVLHRLMEMFGRNYGDVRDQA